MIRRHTGAFGFTLLEMVVSVAIIALVGTVLSQVFISTIRTNTKTEISKEVKQNGDIALGSMVHMIQNARSVVTACSPTGTSSPSLTLINADGETTTYACDAAGSLLRIASISASQTGYLSSEAVTLTGTACNASSLQFICKGAAGIPSSITISFSLAQKGTPVDQFETSSEMFQTSAVMRNSP